MKTPGLAEDSAAADGLLRVGDIVVSVNGITIENYNHAVGLLRASVGPTRVTVKRAGGVEATPGSALEASEHLDHVNVQCQTSSVLACPFLVHVLYYLPQEPSQERPPLHPPFQGGEDFPRSPAIDATPKSGSSMPQGTM